MTNRTPYDGRRTCPTDTRTLPAGPYPPWQDLESTSMHCLLNEGQDWLLSTPLTAK
jgi:hypothetical protein